MKAADAIKNVMKLQEQFQPKFFEDMRDAPLTSPTPRGGNHPLWIAGHLACSEEQLRGGITGETNPLAHWEKYFNFATEPTDKADDYPSYDEVCNKYNQARAKTMALLDEMSDEQIGEAPKYADEQMAEMFPTNADVFMLIVIHRQQHFGQLTDARRAAGRKPLMM